jgi:hypothetical protein
MQSSSRLSNLWECMQHLVCYCNCSAIVVLSERVEYTVQRALFRSLGTALGGDVTACMFALLLPCASLGICPLTGILTLSGELSLMTILMCYVEAEQTEGKLLTTHTVQHFRIRISTAEWYRGGRLGGDALQHLRPQPVHPDGGVLRLDRHWGSGVTHGAHQACLCGCPVCLCALLSHHAWSEGLQHIYRRPVAIVYSICLAPVCPGLTSLLGADTWYI